MTMTVPPYYIVISRISLLPFICDCEG